MKLNIYMRERERERERVVNFFCYTRKIGGDN